MSSVGSVLLEALGPVERPGDFCTGGMREIVMPTVNVAGVGRIAFPVLQAQVERLVAVADPAPYGRGEETVVDRNVRRTWQIDPGRVRIEGRRWRQVLDGLAADAALGLGVSGRVEAEFCRLRRGRDHRTPQQPAYARRHQEPGQLRAAVGAAPPRPGASVGAGRMKAR